MYEQRSARWSGLPLLRDDVFLPTCKPWNSVRTAKSIENAFTKTNALTAKYNITVKAIAPGYTSTEMVQEIPEQVASRIRSHIPRGRFAPPKGSGKSRCLPRG
jgi:NAD(P)-dependent dehydrogenase (short-subunit alcohol dehydrogenase family)